MKRTILSFSRDGNALCILEPEKKSHARMHKQHKVLEHDKKAKHKHQPTFHVASVV
jgi:hypothetical protein